MAPDGPTYRPDNCCGDYPKRFPYSSENRGCCGLKPYKTDVYECCGGSSIEPIGTCGYNHCYPNPCEYGSCQQNPFSATGFVCICDEGWTGEYCQYRSCDYLTCHNQGVATYNTNTNQCECSCPSGISGNHCEITPCNPYDPCMNGSECSFEIMNNAVEFTCTCKPGWTGVFCQNGGDQCNGKVCQNQGVLDSNCYCNCPSGITGDYCEITPCNPYDPCMNDSECSFDIINNSGKLNFYFFDKINAFLVKSF